MPRPSIGGQLALQAVSADHWTVVEKALIKDNSKITQKHHYRVYTIPTEALGNTAETAAALQLITNAKIEIFTTDTEDVIYFVTPL